MSSGVGHRHGSDLMLLCLWHRPAAIALIKPLPCETPCATSSAPKSKNKNKKTNNKINKMKLSEQKYKLQKLSHYVTLDRPLYFKKMYR